MHPGAQDRPRHPILNTTERLEQNDQTVNSQLRVLRGPHAHHHLPCKPPAPLRGGPVVLGNGTCLPHPALDLPVLPAKDNSSTGPPGPIPACLSQGQHSSNPPLISLGRQFSSLLGFLSGVKMHKCLVVKAQPPSCITKIQILALPLNCPVTLGKLLNLSLPQVPPLQIVITL